MTVDRIEPLDKRRCKVFLDGDFAFVLYRGELERYQISEGKELPEQMYEQIFREIICRRTRERALHLLKFSSRTEQELRRRLLKAYYPERAVAEAVRFLKEYHYLDDEQYTANYIEIHGKRKSRMELTGDLLKKGIDKSSIIRLLEELEPDEEEQIKRLLEKRRFSDQAEPAEKRKTIAFLMRRGFSYDKISRVIGRLEEEDFLE